MYHGFIALVESVSLLDVCKSLELGQSEYFD